MYTIRPYQRILLPVLLIGLLITGCAGIGKADPADVRTDQVNRVVEEPVLSGLEATQDIPVADPSGWGELQPKVDKQGQIEVKVTPVNLNELAETIDFEIVMDTHSVDLSMDLAELATLQTDTGQKVQAIIWNAPQGGHHVAGILSFPSTSPGDSVLVEAVEVQLTISDLDGVERVFVWQKP